MKALGRVNVPGESGRNPGSHQCIAKRQAMRITMIIPITSSHRLRKNQTAFSLISIIHFPQAQDFFFLHLASHELPHNPT